MEISLSKLNRQLTGIEHWIHANFIGTLNWIMGFGKTYGGILAINSCREINQNLTVTILVPNVTTKDRWLAELDNEKITDVTVITMSEVFNKWGDKPEIIFGDLLIVDELHRFTSEQALSALEGYFKFTKRLGLTGTYPTSCERMHKLFPVVDKIGEKESISNAWISNYSEFNVPLDMSDDDQNLYYILSENIRKLQEGFKDSFRRLNGPCSIWKDDVDVIYSCIRGKQVYPDNRYIKEKRYIDSATVRETLANLMGWNSNLDLTTEYGQQREKYWNPSNIKKHCELYNEHVRRRTDLMSDNSVKLNAVLEIVNSLKEDDRVIIFNESTEFADKLCDAINNRFSPTKPIAVVFHSNVSSRFMMNPITGDYYRYTTGDKAGQPKKFGKANLKKDAMDGIQSGRYKIIVCVNALNEGFNVEAINIAVTTSGTTNPIQQEQRTARPKRIDFFNPDKLVKIYNLYFNDFYKDDRIIICRDRVKLEYRQTTAQIKSTKLDLYDLINES